ncbi:hypothetical protein ACU686_15075 [Yinghuangia aomiensis]
MGALALDLPGQRSRRPGLPGRHAALGRRVPGPAAAFRRLAGTGFPGRGDVRSRLRPPARTSGTAGATACHRRRIRRRGCVRCGVPRPRAPGPRTDAAASACWRTAPSPRHKRATFAISASLFAVFLYTTLYLQTVVGLSPLRAGLVYLPGTIAMFVVAGATSSLGSRLRPRYAVAGSLVLVSLGLVLSPCVRAPTTRGRPSCPAPS